MLSARAIAVLERSFVIAVSTVCCVGVAAGVALTVQWLFLPPSDGAYGTPLLLLFLDPFVLVVMVEVCGLAVCVALPLALLLLLGTQLHRSILIVAGVTLALTAVGSIGHAFVGAVFGMMGGIAAMVWCRFQLPERMHKSGAASARQPATQP